MGYTLTDDTVIGPQGAQGPPGGIGSAGGVGEKVRIWTFPDENTLNTHFTHSNIAILDNVPL